MTLEPLCFNCSLPRAQHPNPNCGRFVPLLVDEDEDDEELGLDDEPEMDDWGEDDEEEDDAD